MGSDLVDVMAGDFAEALDLSKTSVRKDLFDIKPSSPGYLFWEMDFSRALETKTAGRQLELPFREFSTRRPAEFPKGILVRIITAGDVWVQETLMAPLLEGGSRTVRRFVEVCEQCEEWAEKTKESPITIEEARKILPMHPHCRCSVAVVTARWQAMAKASRPRPPRRTQPLQGQIPQMISFNEFARKMADAAMQAGGQVLMGIGT